MQRHCGSLSPSPGKELWEEWWQHREVNAGSSENKKNKDRLGESDKRMAGLRGVHPWDQMDDVLVEIVGL